MGGFKNAPTPHLWGTEYAAGQSQYYFPQPFTTAPGTVAPTINELRASPVSINRPINLTKIGAEVTGAGAAGSVLRLGIFSDLNGAPGSLLLDAGTIDGTSATVQEITIAQYLPCGNYWVAAVAQVAVPTVGALPATGSLFCQTGLASIPTTAQRALGYAIGGVTGALPVSWGSTLTSMAAGAMPRIFWKATA